MDTEECSSKKCHTYVVVCVSVCVCASVGACVGACVCVCACMFTEQWLHRAAAAAVTARFACVFCAILFAFSRVFCALFRLPFLSIPSLPIPLPLFLFLSLCLVADFLLFVITAKPQPSAKRPHNISWLFAVC